MPFESWSPERAGEIIGAHRHLPGATLPMLHALQEEFGYVPAEAVPLVADALNLSRAEVLGVVSFYHDFRAMPPGRVRGQALPRRGLPVDGQRGAGRRPRAAARRRLRRDDAPTARHAGGGLLPRQLRAARPPCLIDGGCDGRVSTPTRSSGRSRRPKGEDADHEHAPLRAPRCRRLSRSAPTRSPTRCASAMASRAASTRRSCATARAALFWLEPLVEVETPAGRIAYGPVAPRTCRACSTPGCSTARRTRCASARPRRSPTSSSSSA